MPQTLPGPYRSPPIPSSQQSFDSETIFEITPVEQPSMRSAQTRKSASPSRARTPPRPTGSATSVQNPAYSAPSSRCSEDEWDEDSSGHSNDSDSDYQHDVQGYTLPLEHEYQQLRPELLRLSQTELEEWASRVYYDAPPRTRSRMANRQPEPLWLEEDEDSSDTELVVLSRMHRTRRYFHLDCPFHALDPVKYEQCLVQDDWQSIEGLIDHISRNHMKPFYCARCSGVFPTAIDRDNHILDKQCELLEHRPIDGIDHYQKAKLWRRDRWYLDERKRWQRIWNTVFPTKPPRSPYVDQGLGLEVAMARDFWGIHGWRCVSKLLMSPDWPNNSNGDDERALNALCDLALQDLINDIIGGHSSAATS